MLVIHSERIVRDMVERIVKARRNIDLLFASRCEGKTKLLKQSEMAILDISKLCANEEDFNNRILSLSNLITGLESEAMKSQIKTEHGDLSGSITMLEA